MLSISTAWNYRSGMLMEEMLAQILKTGLSAIELGYKISREDLARIERLLKQSSVQVLSVHNFCPVPDDYPTTRHPSNYYRLSSLDEAERCLAVKWTKESINTARRTGALALVVHAGTVEMPEEWSEGLFKRYKLTNEGGSSFSLLREQFVHERIKRQGPYLEAVIKSFKEILPYAVEQNIKIGLESRYYPTEIPNYEEMNILLSKFHQQGLWYWHDVGHSEVNDRLGIYSHQECLARYQKYLLGFHLHGVEILQDHRAPFAGDFDLRKVYPFMKTAHIKVIESHQSATLPQIQTAVAELLKLEGKCICT